MSSIDTKIEEYKKMLTDLEKQKKDEEEAYRDTIDWNMEQLDKFVENIEIKADEWKIKKEKEIRIIVKDDESKLGLYMSTLTSMFYSELYSKGWFKRLNSTENINHFDVRYNNEYIYNTQYRRHHIFEFVYKILKHLFTSNNKLSNDYDNVISRLDKIEEQVNILDNENKYLKDKLYDLI